MGREDIGGWQMARAAILKEVDEEEQMKAIEEWEKTRAQGLSLDAQIK